MRANGSFWHFSEVLSSVAKVCSWGGEADIALCGRSDAIDPQPTYCSAKAVILGAIAWAC